MASSAAFREVLLQAIDDALLVPGELVRAAIYSRVEKSYRIRREEIPEKLGLFHEALQQVLGASAMVMERMIAKNLYHRLDLNFSDHEHWTVLDYVDHAKKAQK